MVQILPNGWRLLIFSILFGYMGLTVLPAYARLQEDSEYTKLAESIDITFKAENELMDQLRGQLVSVRKSGEKLANELDGIRLQVSAQTNLLLVPTVPAEELDRARAVQKTALDKINQSLKEKTDKLNEINLLLNHAKEQYLINEKQLSGLRAKTTKDALKDLVISKMQALLYFLETKLVILESLQEMYSDQIDQLESTKNILTESIAKLDAGIMEKSKKQLFQRKTTPLFTWDWNGIRNELTQRFKKIISLSFWKSEFEIISENTSTMIIVSWTLIFFIIQILLFRLRRQCLLFDKKHDLSAKLPWRSLTLQVFYRSLPLLGIFLFLYIYTNVRNYYSASPFVRSINYLILVLLFTKWIRDFLKAWRQNPLVEIPEEILQSGRNLLRVVSYLASIYIILDWAFRGSGVLVFAFRLVFELLLLVLNLRFWKTFRDSSLFAVLEKNRVGVIIRSALMALGNTIVLAGLLIELAGFGPFAVYWYTSWACTSIVGFWAILLFFVIIEWNSHFHQTSAPNMDGEVKASVPIRWLVIKLSWFAWFIAVVIGLAYAWGATHSLILSFFKLLSHPVSIGEMKFSVMGFIYAFLIILIIHAAIRFWRDTLLKRFLAASGLEAGLKESIATISVYLFWIIGILIALHVVGVNTASMAVGFGALGIGLGFGLQNIFNNFVSGIILLFERPIQVGDAVEVDGVWGEVKKINVRSTQVQTYDNAALIIPNSEIISKQVTNWSYKDFRIRRTIAIGVAYGSDVGLVKQTLLEIADNTPRVLKYPAPYVLFTDFGDSALVFKLRFWTDLDYFIHTQSDMMYEIDRLFNERDITIPFPQRDVHFYPEKKSDQPVIVEYKNDDEKQKDMDNPDEE